MIRGEVSVGTTYVMKVNGNLTTVRITQDNGFIDIRGKRKHRGWTGINTKTNRKIFIRSAAKLRFTAKPE